MIDYLKKLFKKRTIQAIRITAVSGSKEIVLFYGVCTSPFNKHGIVVPNGYDLVCEPIFTIQNGEVKSDAGN